MRVKRIEHMYFAKTVPSVRYDLSYSGVPPVRRQDYGAEPEDLESVPLGPYGHPELIERIAERYHVPIDCVVPVPGTSMGNYLSLVATLEPGQTILLEEPHYECLAAAIRMFGARAEPFARLDETRFAPDLQQVEDGLRRGARAVMLSNLHNPTGLVLSDASRDSLIELTDRFGAALIIDEVYLDFPRINTATRHPSAATMAPHVVTTSSLTKVYGLGGLRAGWLLADPERAETVRRAMDYFTVNNASPSMNLAIRAFCNIDRLEKRTRDLYQTRWPIMRDWLASRPDLTCPGNDGALFVFVGLGAAVDGQRLVDLLVRKYDTLVVPGRFFDRPNHIRISFHLPPVDLRNALDRIGQAVDEARSS